MPRLPRAVLMAGSRTSRKTKTKGRGKKTPMDRATLDRWLAGGLLAVALSTALALVPMMRRSIPAVTTAREVRFIAAPEWADDSLLRHLAETALNADDAAPDACVDRGTLVGIAQSLEDSGWFDQVRQVQRTADGALEVDAVFLAPMAWVTDRHGDAVVDGQGRLLPEACGFTEGAHVVKITSPRRDRPVRARRAWESNDVHAALALLQTIQDCDWITQVEAIDCDRWRRNGHLVMVTDSGARIIWGSAPGTETPLEALSPRKLVRLDHLFQNSGRVDQHHRGEIDLTDASVVVRR